MCATSGSMRRSGPRSSFTLNFLEGDALPSRIPQPQVMASDEEWDKICGVLFARGNGQG